MHVQIPILVLSQILGYEEDIEIGSCLFLWALKQFRVCTCGIRL